MKQQLGAASPRNSALTLEQVRLSQWRRMLLRAEGPELTIAEAAVVLGVPVEDVHRRIRSGQLHAYRNGGEIRIVPYLGDSSHAQPIEASEQLKRLWEAFKSARVQLDESLRNRDSLESELANLKASMDFLQRRLETLSAAADSPRAAQADRQKVQAQIVDIRNLARRRMKPWALVG